MIAWTCIISVGQASPKYHVDPPRNAADRSEGYELIELIAIIPVLGCFLDFLDVFRLFCYFPQLV